MTIQKIIRIAQQAGELLMKYYQQDLTIRSKSKGRFNPVTPADIEADAFIRSALQKLFPNDLILSEENKDVPADFSGRVWMVDPLDGTKQFIRQSEGFAVIIGLAINGIPSLGVVYAPARGETYYAKKGKGAYVVTGGKKQRLRVSEQDKFSESTQITKTEKIIARIFNILIKKLELKVRKTDTGFALKSIEVSRGDAEAYVHPSFNLGKWDTCGPECILKEAGGEVTNLFGEKLNYKQQPLNWQDSVILSNRRLHPQIIDTIKKSRLFLKKN